jgi:energy-coupling factor transporter ATP-binding protein EcfA2
MITAIKIVNFKALQDTGWIPVPGNVVFIGPNNSGKTTALQALALWSYGLQKWIEKKKTSKAVIRTGAVINRKDLFALPVTSSKYLWTDLFPQSSDRDASGKIKRTKFNNIEISVKGLTHGREWICGLEFRYDSEETIYVKPIQDLDDNIASHDVEVLKSISIAFLPPLSGLKLEEEKLLFSTVEYRMGEGRTAEVLGNVCYQLLYPETEMLSKNRKPKEDWKLLNDKLKKLFLIELMIPELDSKGIINLKYIDARGNKLEIASSGRGMQQIILLIAYLSIKPNCIILLDEPDAHLEILKQEQVYELLSDIAHEKDSQLLIASHSEVVLRKAVNTNDHVLAFYPHANPKLINDKGSEVLKSLRTIGFEEYYLAQQTGWVLYLEGGLDLPILKKFAEKLRHPVLPYLENCFYKTINTNDPAQARNHFTGLKDAKPDLTGIAIYDNISNPLNVLSGLHEIKWEKNEIENYFFSQNLLLAWARGKIIQDLFGPSQAQKRVEAMGKALDDILPGAARRNEKDNYWSEMKASAEMEKILKAYYRYLEHPGDTSKSKFVEMIDYLPDFEIDGEILQKLDFIFHLIPDMKNG